MNPIRNLLLSATLLSVFAAFGALLSAQSRSGSGKGYAAIPPDAYSVFAEVRAKPGKADELRSVTLPLIALVRGDPKNLVYFFQEDRESPGHLIFFEVWANRADFEAHNNMRYVKDWFAKLPALAEGGVRTTRMRVLHEPAK